MRIWDDPTILVRKPLDWIGTVFVYIGVCFWGAARCSDNGSVAARVYIVKDGQEKASAGGGGGG